MSSTYDEILEEKPKGPRSLSLGADLDEEKKKRTTTDGSLLDKEGAPEDKGNVVYLLMTFFGISILLPWNAVLTSLDFFDGKMHEYHPASVFGFAVNGLVTVTSVLTMVYGSKLSYVTRISGSYLFTAALMVILPFITESLNSGSAFAADMVILTFSGMLGGVIQASSFALGGMLPGKFMGALMFGQGISGISLNLLRAVCLLIIPDNSYKGALIYFMLAAVILVFSAIANWKFMQLPFVKYYIKKSNEKSVLERNYSEHGPGSDINKSVLKQRITTESNYLPPTEHSENQKPQKAEVSPLKAFLGRLVEGYKATWQYLSSLSIVFMITFTIFPAVITDTSLNFL